MKRLWLPHRERLKAVVEAWIDLEVRGDVARGRHDGNFTDDPAKTMKRQVRLFNAAGTRIYVGSGNLFLADVAGLEPRVIQRRPLAQREIVLEAEHGES